MANLFFIQLRALIWKNWIVLSKHSFLNILRCFILPVAYGVFLAVAQIFLNKPNNLGIGEPVSVFSLQEQFDGRSTLIWADGTDGTSVPSPSDIMSRITASFTHAQLKAVKKVGSPADIPFACPQNFNFLSECFAAVAFNDIPANTSTGKPVNYTIRADAGLTFIDVIRHASDFEKRILPLQWAIDQAIIDLKTGVKLPTPLEWPYTTETNEEQSERIRLSYVRGIRELLVIALFVCFVGIAYQLPGAVAGERANGITAHMRAMGLLDRARILSWHISISLTYLPAWIIVGVTWRFRIFALTNTGLIIVVHILVGLVLCSWSFFIAAPFGKSPQLAAVVTTFLSIMFVIIALVMKHASNGTAFIFSIIFPPGFYVFALRAIAGYENHLQPTNVTKGDPDNHLVLLVTIVAAVIDVFLWPYLAVLLERWLYEVPDPAARSWIFWKKREKNEKSTIPDNVAISVRNLKKSFRTSIFSRKSVVTAISDLSFDIPKTGIFVLLGSNGAGKSTSLSIMGGLLGRTSGTMVFEGGVARPPRGTMGIVPQKNVLFPELTCSQTLHVWKAVKWSKSSASEEDVEQLLRDCDLEAKIHSNAATLSGGQKRKLQLAIGLVGGSKIVLVDECTSGVDPLSRRALWRTLTSFRDDCAIVFTTHFLDEADLLADHIAILAAPGKLVASGSPVALKRDLGEGYSVHVSFPASLGGEKAGNTPDDELTQKICAVAPQAYATVTSPHQICFHLKTRDAIVVGEVLQLLDREKGTYSIASYDVLGTSIEDIFLDLMSKNDGSVDAEASTDTSRISEKPEPGLVQLANGRKTSPLKQALTIFYKRRLIARRSWLTPVLTILVAVAGATIPLVFIRGKQQNCTRKFANSTNIPLYLPNSPIVPFTFGPSSRVLTSPPGITSVLGHSVDFFRITNVTDNAAFVNTIQQNYRNLSLGGISLDLTTRSSLIAWEATPPGITGPSMLNLATNIHFNNALTASGDPPTIIRASYDTFPPVGAGTLVSLKWMGFFGAVMAVFPAFFALYVSRERRSSVQAMQMSNGLADPVGLWLGHLMFDTIISTILATIIIIVFATASNQFQGLGFLWFVMVLYGITGALFAYCVSLLVASPLAAFATVAGYQVIMFVLYLSGYLLTLTYGKTSAAPRMITIIHFTLSLASPIASVIRAALVAVNLFSLLCDGTTPVTSASMGQITRFGGPILYLFVYSLVLLAILVCVDSGALLPRRARAAKKRRSRHVDSDQSTPQDIVQEAKAASDSQDLLRILDVSKSYDGNRVVDGVSLGVSQNTIFALLGPNGAGKTTTFNMIRGDVVPDTGDVFIAGTSVIHHPRTARLSLGVCPQFTAIDSQLTVREHLLVYGRLKGLTPGPELEDNVESILRETSLVAYADRLASKLSGGNQRKLSLAIALMGNPAVVLIDEFSTGIDAKMKRDMWQTLRNVAAGKAVVITTHSMEEASALSNRVGIIAERLLAVGTTESLSARYATYEVHFSCRTRDEVAKAQALMAKIPRSRMADDVATRFEVPVEVEGMSLAQLFTLLSSQGDFSDYTVEKASLESVFLKTLLETPLVFLAIQVDYSCISIDEGAPGGTTQDLFDDHAR
ncbi:putative ABC-2 family transporter protein [Lyophyllum shimeji]|uniref:ABC-2 family transporter protein n=1 Tax=Lyophyllum shimeji TaxID=47721 RepID=A0A9P3PY14_LYOSH|nr:putative ABC-2 family transporter protein [Lyophyllum shimeji]